jgi:hypothetical protein
VRFPANAAPLALVTLAACSGGAPGVTASGWPEADALFHADPRWLGADGAYTVDLGGDRTLWLFGDTFLAREPGGSAADAFFLRNTVAVQTGRDPSDALMAFFWGVDDDGTPRSFVAQDGADWFWPGGGARLGGELLLFFGRIRTPPGDPSGFESTGWRAIVVDDPDDDPSAWTMHDAITPDTGGIHPGTAVLVDGGYLYAYAEKSDVNHDVYLVRWAVAGAAGGDLSSPEWWCGGGWSPACSGGPGVVVPEGAPEFSVQPGGSFAPFVLVQTEGFGAATLALRTAAAPEGPWSGPQSFFRPPESREGDADVYAGKAHAGLVGADLVATYVPADLYRPRFVRVSYPR